MNAVTEASPYSACCIWTVHTATHKKYSQSGEKNGQNLYYKNAVMKGHLSLRDCFYCSYRLLHLCMDLLSSSSSHAVNTLDCPLQQK